MALGVARDADLVEAGPPLAHGREQRRGALERARGLVRVAGGDEQPADAGRLDAVEQLGEVGGVADLTRGQVRDHPVAPAGEPLAQLERGVEALLGEPVTVIVTSLPSDAATPSSIPSSGSTS